MLAELEAKTGCRIQVYVSTWSSVRAAIEKRLETTAAFSRAQLRAAPTPASEGAEAAEETDAEGAEVSAPGEETSGMSELGSLLLGDAGPEGKE